MRMRVIGTNCRDTRAVVIGSEGRASARVQFRDFRGDATRAGDAVARVPRDDTDGNAGAGRTFTALGHHGRGEDNLMAREGSGRGVRQRARDAAREITLRGPRAGPNTFRARVPVGKRRSGLDAMLAAVGGDDRACVPSCVSVTIRGFSAIANARPAFCTFERVSSGDIVPASSGADSETRSVERQGIASSMKKASLSDCVRVRLFTIFFRRPPSSRTPLVVSRRGTLSPRSTRLGRRRHAHVPLPVPVSCRPIRRCFRHARGRRRVSRHGLGLPHSSTSWHELSAVYAFHPGLPSL